MYLEVLAARGWLLRINMEGADELPLISHKMEIQKEEPKSVAGEHKRFVIPSQETDSVPVRSLFQAPNTAQSSCVKSAGSYADYVFQNVTKGPERKPQDERVFPCPEQKPQIMAGDSKEVTGFSSVQSDIPALKSGGGRSCIVVSTRQRGNPLLKHVRNIPWEFGDIVPDYVLGETCCALFLSLRYHNLNPEYIHTRLRTLGQSYALRILLVQVDVKDPHFSLKELAKICILADCTLILSWSPDEAARYLETYKCYEQKPADALKERTESDFMSRVTDCLTTVKSVNKTDSCTLLTTFGTVADLANASREDLSLCPGLGPQKAKRLFDTLHEPFLKTKK